MTAAQNLNQAVHDLMPTAINNLEQLVAIPSVASHEYPREQVLEAAQATENLLRASGFQQVRQLELLSGYPAIYGEISSPTDAPTVLLYAHYDVQPPGREQEWKSPPFEPTIRDGRLYGRGAADDKSGLVAHIATIQAFAGHPPVNIKIVVEGDEEFSSSLPAYIAQAPDLFRADIVVICDHGSITIGEPTITTTLRGSAELTLEVRTLADQQHNGIFGGPIPDAFIALNRIVATLHDENGNIQVPGLQPSPWQGADIPEDKLRRAAGLLPDVDLIGSRSLSAQLWAGYSINVIGLDTPSIAGASNSLIDVVRARINLRVPPDQSAERALQLLTRHLKSVAPWHAKVTITDSHASDGFTAKADGPAYKAAFQALEEAYGKDAEVIGDGASIPLTNILSQQFPEAEILIWGAEDLEARIHGPNESVSLGELERLILTQALFLSKLGVKA